MYTALVRRIQLYIEEDADDALAAEARRNGVAKAELIRGAVRRHLAAGSQEPVSSLIGQGDGDPVDDIDTALYDR